MPAPTSYTEASLLAFLEDGELGLLAGGVGILETDALLQAVYSVERLIGHGIEAETDVAKLEALARWQGWLTVWGAAAGQYDLGSSGDSLKRSQFFDHLTLRLRDAEAAALRYDEAAAVLAGGSTGYVGGMSTAGSPYSYGPCAEWS